MVIFHSFLYVYQRVSLVIIMVDDPNMIPTITESPQNDSNSWLVVNPQDEGSITLQVSSMAS